MVGVGDTGSEINIESTEDYVNRFRAKQEALFAGLGRGLGVREAAREAGMTTAQAKSCLRRANIRKMLGESFAKMGIDADRLARVIDEGLKGQQVIAFSAGKAGVYREEVPDHNVRHKFARLAFDVVEKWGDEVGSEDEGDDGVIDVGPKSNGELLKLLSQQIEREMGE